MLLTTLPLPPPPECGPFTAEILAFGDCPSPRNDKKGVVDNRKGRGEGKNIASNLGEDLGGVFNRLVNGSMLTVFPEHE